VGGEFCLSLSTVARNSGRGPLVTALQRAHRAAVSFLGSILQPPPPPRSVTEPAPLSRSRSHRRHVRREAGADGEVPDSTLLQECVRATHPACIALSIARVLQSCSHFVLPVSPPSFSSLNPRVVKDLIHSVLSEHLKSRAYDQNETGNWTKEIATQIKAKLKELKLPRYKFLVQVIIGEMKGAGVRSGGENQWTTKRELDGRSNCGTRRIKKLIAFLCSLPFTLQMRLSVSVGSTNRQGRGGNLPECQSITLGGPRLHDSLLQSNADSCSLPCFLRNPSSVSPSPSEFTSTKPTFASLSARIASH
jgi:hypothetical protein